VTAISILKRNANDLFRGVFPAQDLDSHLIAAANWLRRAQDHGNDDGVSYGYSLKGGWRDSYVETSGYIATTFFTLAERLGDDDFRQRAIRIANWLCSVQNPDGSFSNHRFSGEQGIVFDTGQDLFGLIRAWRETGDDRYHNSAIRAGDWLVKVADDRGIWTRNTFNGIPHVYNSRTAWALLQLFEVTENAEYRRIACANLDWAVENESGGYFRNCAFEKGQPPFTHNIAYAIRGLLESGYLIDVAKYRDVAQKAATAMLDHVDANGFIPGQIDDRGNARASYCCLTGNAQMSIIWLKLYRDSGDTRYLEAARRATRYVMTRQDLATDDPDIHGAISGSYPIWGKYSPLTYPNWPAKFFVDALMHLKDATE